MTPYPPVVVAAVPLTGHTRPMLAVARLLVRAGREVIFLGASRFAEAAAATGARFVPLEGEADFDDRRIAQDHPEYAAMPPGMDRSAYEMRVLLGGRAPAQSVSLQRVLASAPDAALVHDLSFFGTWPQQLGAPGLRPRRTIGVGVFPLSLPGAELTPAGPPPDADGRTALGGWFGDGYDDAADGEPPAREARPRPSVREAAAAANKQFRELMAPALSAIEDILHQAGAVEPLHDWFDAVHLFPDAVAQLTVPSFEYPRIDAPANLHFVGALPPEPIGEWTPPPWWSTLSERRVVVVTQGTMANSDLGDLVQPTLDALADTDVCVVAALGRDPEPGELRIPENAHVAAFLPFDELFPLAEAVVTNGGYGATQLALAHGLPLVVAGATEDKAAIAGRVSHFGVGIGIPVHRVEPDMITDAVTRILDDPRFRERAAALRAEYAEADPAAAIIDLIDGRDDGSPRHP